MAEPVVEAVAQVTTEVVEAVARLVPQLSSTAGPPGEAELETMLASADDTLFVARLNEAGEIVGMLSFVTYRIPTGLHGVIEDVVVDDAARGSGVGTTLIEAALGEARRRGVRNVDLTSRPSREEANRLYVKLGFEQRQTNVYRYRLSR